MRSPDISTTVSTIGSRQFVVADRPCFEDQGWVVRRLGDEIILLGDAQARVQTA